MNEPQITITGNLGNDPVLRSTAQGIPVVDLRVASSPRIKVGEEWVDGETTWFDVVCWKQTAENVGNSLKKGDRIVVEGKLRQDTWTREDGSTSVKLMIDARQVGVDLSRYPVKVVKPVRPGSAADLLSAKWASTHTGEVVDAPIGDPGPLVPFSDNEEVAA